MIRTTMVAQILPFLQQKQSLYKCDRVREVMEGVESGRLKRKRFEKAIEDFSLNDLERLSDELITYRAEIPVVPSPGIRREEKTLRKTDYRPWTTSSHSGTRQSTVERVKVTVERQGPT